MRVCLSLAVAVMAFAAQAVTITWSYANPGNRRPANEGYEAYNLPKTSGHWTFRAELKLAAYSGSAFIGVGNANDIPKGYGGAGERWGAGALDIVYNNDVYNNDKGIPKFWIWEEPNKLDYWQAPKRGVTLGETFGFALEFKANADGVGGALAFYLNGNYCGSHTFVAELEPVNCLFFRGAEVDAAEFGSGLFANQDEGIRASKVGGALPEPTVLALLAFGVAGVALRRKVD